MPVGALGMAAIQTGMQFGIDQVSAGINNERALRHQRGLNEEQKKMMDYQLKKQMELWEKTGYKPQMEQMKEAGLNPALMYGGTGSGGSTATGSAGNASNNSSQTKGVDIGESMEVGMQMALLKAQKENIEADTARKKAEEQNLSANTEGKGIENAFNSYMMSTSPEGTENVNIGESTRGKQEMENVNRTRVETKFKLDENERQRLMNSEVMKEIGAKISLMHKQGLSQDEIYKNLQKEGKLLDAEIEWNKLDIENGNVGKFISNIIKMLFRPR